MNRFVLTKPAERDLLQIQGYLLEKASARIARRVLNEIRIGIAIVGRDPGVGHLRQDLTARPLKFWSIYSYLIVYDPLTQPIQIIRVLHGMSDVEDILN